MNFSQFWAILRARKWIFLWIFAVVVLVTTIVSLLLPKSYTATASLVVNAKGSDPITGSVLPASMLPGYIATQVDILESRAVALRVVDEIKVTQNQAAKEKFEKATDGKGDIRTWFADQFLESLDVKPSRESSLIELNFTATDPQFAAIMANSFAKAYIETSVRLKVDPAKEAAQFFESQLKGIRDNVEKAQAKLSAYQKAHGITSTDSRVDEEVTRLNDLSSQLVLAQGQRYDSTSRSKQIAHGGAGESPETMANTLIQGLKSQLVQAEAKLSELSQRTGENHPQYLAAKQDVDNIKASIQRETAKTGGSVGQTAKVSEQKESEVKAALEAQKAKVLRLKSEQDEMAVLLREADGAQKIYDTALMRFSQSSIEGQSAQTDVAILNAATPPLKHSRPKVLLNILLSIFLGAILAITVALLYEMTDRKLRDSADLFNNLSLPVLIDMTAGSEGKFAKPLLKKLTKSEDAAFSNNLLSH